jgi:predicted O-methyltransferase YrrM
VALSAIAQRLQPKTVLELGTFDSRTTLHLAANAADDARVHTIDEAGDAIDFGSDAAFCEAESVGHWFRGHALADRIEQTTADTATFDFSRFRHSVDLVFVDADHSEAAVLRDSAEPFAMLAAGGTVIWHDYPMIPDVTRALSKLASERDVVHIAGTTLAIAFDASVASGSR